MFDRYRSIGRLKTVTSYYGGVGVPVGVGVFVDLLAVLLEGGQEVRCVEAHGARHIHSSKVVHEKLAVVRVVRRARVQFVVHEILHSTPEP